MNQKPRCMRVENLDATAVQILRDWQEGGREERAVREMRQGKKAGGGVKAKGVINAHVEGEEEGEDKREAVDAVDAGALVGAADDDAVCMPVEHVGVAARGSRVPPVEGLCRPRAGHLGDHRLLRGRVARPFVKPDNVAFRSPARVEAHFSEYEEYEEDRDV